MIRADQLVKRLKQGDPSSQNQIIQAYKTRLFFYFSTRIKGDAPKEDLVQEVLACFFDAVGKGKLLSDHVIAPYIFGIAKRVLYNFYYQSNKNKSLREKAQQIWSGFEDFQEEQRLETENLAQVISEIIQRISPLDQQILNRYFYRDQSIGEIAEEMNHNRHYISVRKDRALKRIRIEMEKRKLTYR